MHNKVFIPWGLFLCGVLFLLGCSGTSVDTVVVYTSQDQIYASEILASFEQETGIRVLPLYDSESVKTTGLVNRLISERRRPRCDVFWSNEELMVRRLISKGILEDTTLCSFGYRSRRLVINTNLVDEADLPTSLKELTAPKWRGRVALAYPLYGTTVTHLMALRGAWGNAVWREWCDSMLGNETRVLDGNSAVVQMVGKGSCWIGLTDSDDISVGQRQGYPIRGITLEKEFPTIANSAARVVSGPNPRSAQVLLDYLSRPETVSQLVKLGALQGDDPAAQRALVVDWTQVMNGFDDAFRWLEEVFFR